MDISIIAMTVVGISTNLICFLLGMIYGRNTAYKTVRTFETADTVSSMPSVKDSKFISQ